MTRGLWTAASGMAAQETNIDVIANNLANVNTTGFKSSRVDFQDLYYQTVRQAGAATADGSQIPSGVQVGLGTRPAAVQKLFTAGDLRQTGNQLDVAIEGDGFFALTGPDGNPVYTRDGSFKLDGTGKLVNTDGYSLETAVTIPAEALSVSIAADGTVSVTTPSSSTPQQIGQIQIARFLNPAGLNNAGHNLFTPTAASGTATTGAPGSQGFGGLAQGTLEMSNVKIVDEMVNMIVAQRAYEINSKCIQTADEMLSLANNLRR
jgi:flagellar basal-body rod protein FlgG